MRGLSASVALVATMIAAPVAAQLAIANPTPPPVPLAEESLLEFANADTRMTVPVTIGARGPWNFVVDTGAERTVVSHELAGVLGLPAARDVRVTAMTGTSTVASVMVPALGAGAIVRATIQAPALAMRDLGAPGLLGIDALQGRSVTIDFDRQRMTLRPSHRRGSHASTEPGEIVVVAKSLFGQLIVTDAHWRKVRIAVVIDTGTPVTIGNLAFLRALTRAPKPLGPLRLTSATGQSLTTQFYALDWLEIGGVQLQNVRVAVADAPPFRRFGIDGRPALMLGMDVLRLFRNVQIDFANREIRFLLPRAMIEGGPMAAR